MVAKHTRTGLVVLVMFTVITGVIYPVMVTAVAQLTFSHEANGSIIIRDGTAVGSALIGQPFDSPGYFWSRPSATAPFPYNAAASGGSNLSSMNPALVERVHHAVARIRSADTTMHQPVPVDLVTASGSGLDPHISPDAARVQVPRIAREHGISSGLLYALVDHHTERPLFGFFGAPRVNVLLLNLDLDGLRQTGGTR